MGNSANVRVGAVGVVSLDSGSGVAPTDASSALVGFNDLGEIGDGGQTEARNRSTNDIKNMSGKVLRTVVTESSVQFKFVLLETRKEVLEAFYGVTVNASDGSLTVDPSLTGGRKKWVLDTTDGTNYERTYLPEAEPTEVGDVVKVAGEAVGYEFTISAYPSTLLAGKSYKKFYSQLVTAALVPVITSVLPSGATAGSLVQITGQYFTGVTGAASVKFGAVNATNYSVVADNIIVATMPAGSAGPANVIVHNAAGDSTAFTYTRGA